VYQKGKETYVDQQKQVRAAYEGGKEGSDFHMPRPRCQTQGKKLIAYPGMLRKRKSKKDVLRVGQGGLKKGHGRPVKRKRRDGKCNCPSLASKAKKKTKREIPTTGENEVGRPKSGNFRKWRKQTKILREDQLFRDEKNLHQGQKTNHTRGVGFNISPQQPQRERKKKKRKKKKKEDGKNM